MWLILGLLSGVILVLRMSRAFRPVENLGSVSSEWLAEYRRDNES